jgi:CBS domain-containing protein
MNRDPYMDLDHCDLEHGFRQDIVKSIIKTEAVIITQNATIWESLRLMREKSADYILVQGNNDQIVGIVTSKDILLNVLSQDAADQKLNNKITEIMTTHIEIIKASATIKSAVLQMYEKGFAYLPVMDTESNKLLGVLSVQNLFQYILDHFPENAYNILLGGESSSEEVEGA